MLLLEKKLTTGGLSHLCVGLSAPSVVVEENKPHAFHSRGAGASLRPLVAEHLSKKQGVGSVFIKTVHSFRGNLPRALRCFRKFRTLLTYRQPHVQWLPATCGTGIPSPSPCLLPYPSLPPCLLLVQRLRSPWGLPMGVAFSPAAASPVQSQCDRPLCAEVVLKMGRTVKSLGHLTNRCLDPTPDELKPWE